ncbi:type I restriction endonuclease subunit R [Pedobacter psychroterrae]|uniref:type I site-specific deoxyribonuclease n=1 Tax=Pedobacter psychroterrae TaxID=2530453 RepID=A0A4R0NHD2_9SPHI|nr:type I restriction endonuclease [Pedobacter psychroterrae]TCC99981.1 type I restriction endonuclease subunit R [Pedobacter psychroterrae]
MAFNEDSRVKIPAILHLIRLGYTYIPRREQDRVEETNIFSHIFLDSVQRINPGADREHIERLVQELALKLDFDDLGKDFYKSLTATSGIKLIDFENFSNNSFHVTTELTCKNGEDEFRPDITLLVNGMPLVFIEVKKPNNKDGVLAERKRINDRYKNKKFKRFANITQMMLFSNNMPYEDGVIEPLQGAYYATSAYADLNFNYFREEENLNLTALLAPENDEIENLILKDNNIIAIKHSPEFITNKHYNSATNTLLTSLLSQNRLAFILKYAIAYIDEEVKGKVVTQKHIMRYPQMFATKAIEQKLNEGVKKGIIWHTQGSGKTALAYYNVKFLTDYYQKRNIIPKFYFIVDRIDLANQASTEFGNRGLVVNRVNSRAEFLSDIKKVSVVHNSAGDREIAVVNIQKFTEETVVVKDLAYDINIQRVYFIDEAHRGYNPKGSTLVNLLRSDESAIKIALTGTPLLREVAKDFDSKALFGDYIHKYYYNMSIADGYTLRLIREGIDTTYKMQMKEVLEQIQLLQGDVDKSEVFAHPKFVEPMLDYIVKDLIQFRKTEGDNSLGAMVVCDTSKQAKSLFAYFEELNGIQEIQPLGMVAEPIVPYGKSKKELRSALILHDVNSKDDRKEQVKQFKVGEVDILFVYNMLLTGFDAKRLKKLYLARVVKDHNLLQTLTRVNRPYKKYKYGYVVDFADISAAFRETNDNYFKELQAELGNEMTNYSNLFKSQEEIDAEILAIKEKLFRFDAVNAEIFSQQVSDIKDKKDLLELIKVLANAKELKNIIRLKGLDEQLDKLDFFKLNQLLNVAQAQLDKLNLIDNINNEADTTNLLNSALEDVIFLFTKVSEQELILADQLRGQLKRTREALLFNFDQKDPAFISLREELERIFKKKNLGEVDQDDMRENILLLKSIYDRVTELNRKNNLLKAKYEHDEKYARLHKRLVENSGINAREIQLHQALMNVKQKTDDQLLNNRNIMDSEGFFNRYLLNLVANEFVKKQNIKLDFNTTKTINTMIAGEYLQQYNNYI